MIPIPDSVGRPRLRNRPQKKKADELNKGLKKVKGMVTAKTKYFKMKKLDKFEKSFFKALNSGEKIWINPEQAKLQDLISKAEKKVKVLNKKYKKTPPPGHVKKVEKLYDDIDAYEDQVMPYSLWKWKIESNIKDGKMNIWVTPFSGQYMKNATIEETSYWVFVKSKLGWKDISAGRKEALLKTDQDVLKYIIYYTLVNADTEPETMQKIKMPPVKRLLGIINKAPKLQDIKITKGMSTKKIMDFIDTIADWKNVDADTMVALVRHKNIPPEYVSVIFKKVKQFSSAGEDAYKKILKTALSKGVIGEKDMARILSDILTML